MRVCCILFGVLLTSVAVSAQSSPDERSTAPQFEFRSLVAPSQFGGGHVPPASQKGENQIGAVPSPWLLQSSEPADDEFLSKLTQDSFPEMCYSIRTYRVTRDDPQSDITSPAGYSECETATRFQMKVVGNGTAKP